MTPQPTAASFLADVQRHQLTVVLDNGLHRSLVLRQPKNSNQWFGIATWPGYLIVYGDMGCWTFARIDDMFRLFRQDRLEINPYYWSEKLQHGQFGGQDGARVFDEYFFKQRLVEQLTQHYSLEGDELAGVTAALQDEVLCQDNRHDLLVAARDFRHGGFEFDGCELPDGMQYSYHFVWCCYAIVWAIQQYDARFAVSAGGPA